MSELIFGNFPITTDIAEKILGKLSGWKCTSGGDSGEDYCSYTKTKGHDRVELAIKVIGDNELNIKLYSYKTPEDNKYMHGMDKDVDHLMEPFDKNFKIPNGKTWEDIDFGSVHDKLVDLNEYIDGLTKTNFSQRIRMCFSKLK